MNVKVLVVIGAVLVGGAWLSLFSVDEREKALLLQLGEIVRSDYEPGLHYLIPFYQSVEKFDRRLLTLDSQPEQILTGEKKNVMVDYFVKWRIQNVEAYYRAFGGLERSATDRMAEIVRDGLQSELGDRTIRDVVSGERQQIMDNVTRRSDEKLTEFGVQVVDVRIKQIELPPKVANSVFQRMRAERDRIAKEHRALGEKEARIIRARADRKRTELLAGAQRQAEELRGKGDAKATATYAEAYTQDSGFYEFYRSLLAYRKAFADKQDVFVVEPDSEFFEYFGRTNPAR